ncbi:uncharacterized [Tachysurus ichikawai]
MSKERAHTHTMEKRKAEQELHHSQSCISAGGAVLNNSELSSPRGQMMQSCGTFASVHCSRGPSTGPVSAVRAPA